MIALPSRSGRIDVQLLLLPQPGDPLLEVVVRARDSRAALRRLRVVQSDRVSMCSRSSSGPASRDVAAHRRVGPRRRRRSRGTAGAARPAARPASTVVLVEPQRLEPAWRELGPDHLVVVEADARRPARTGGSPACRCRAAARRAAARGPGRAPGRRAVLERDRLLEHRQGVLVDVLVPVVLVDLQPQRRQLGQHVVGQPGVDEQREARAAGRGASSSLLSSSRTRSADTIAIRSAIAVIAATHLGVDRRSRAGRRTAPPASSAAGRRRTTPPACPGSAARRRARSSRPPNGSTNVSDGSAHGHRVDREVAPAQVALEACRRTSTSGLRDVAVVALVAVGRDLDHELAACARRSCRTRARRPTRRPPSPRRTARVTSGARVGGEVEVGRRPAETASRTGPPTSARLWPRGREALRQPAEHRGRAPPARPRAGAAPSARRAPRLLRGGGRRRRGRPAARRHDGKPARPRRRGPRRPRAPGGRSAPLATVTDVPLRPLPAAAPPAGPVRCRRWRRPRRADWWSTAAPASARAAVIARLNRRGPVELVACPRATSRQGETPSRPPSARSRRRRASAGGCVAAARHHRVPVLRGRPADPQARAPLPAGGARRDPDDRGRPRPGGHRRGLGTAADSSASVLTFPNERRIAREATALLEDTA